jgi:riboflavin synthase alpha subunit
MYRGFISEIGEVQEQSGAGLVIRAPKARQGLEPGGSVSIAGLCLSAVELGADRFAVDVSTETARRSTLGSAVRGMPVNVELPLRVGDPLEGHLVQGHVDAVAKVVRVTDEPLGRRVWLRPPARFLEMLVAKGSVAVDGVSLTVAEVQRDLFCVALVPVTLASTARCARAIA